jgi:hypothetical protein
VVPAGAGVKVGTIVQRGCRVEIARRPRGAIVGLTRKRDGARGIFLEQWELQAFPWVRE